MPDGAGVPVGEGDPEGAEDGEFVNPEHSSRMQTWQALVGVAPGVGAGVEA